MKRHFGKVLLWMVTLSTLGCQSPSTWLDRSSAIFFPPPMAKTIEANNSFPLFWWNFLVLSPPVSLEQASLLCDRLKQNSALTRAECDSKPTEFQAILEDWSHDFPLRHSAPSPSEIQTSLNRVMVQASLPTGNHALLSLLRTDPFESWKELKAIAESRLKLKLTRTEGFFYDAETKRIVIPVQFNSPPTQSKITHELFKSLNDLPPDSVVLVGAHGSTLQNESQIMRDMEIVKNAGLLTLLIFGVLLFAFKKWRLALLFPIVFLGTGISAGITILVFGSIHGLTLSFGTGIVGLALDYGLQGALNSKLKSIWKSNFCGLMTTVVSLLVLMCSSVPLLRQMMFFSVIGISVSFLLFYFFIKRYSHLLEVAPFSLPAQPRTWKSITTLILLFASIAGFIAIKPDLSMKQFDFQSERARTISQWMFIESGLTPPLFEIHSRAEVLPASLERKQWALNHQVMIESLANYLPSESVQQENLKSWKASEWEKRLTANQITFFQPFIQAQSTHSAHAAELDQKSYLKHLHSDHEWISLWLPDSPAQTSSIKEAYPAVISLRDVVEQFPKTLAQELRWMVPLSILLAALIHFVYYRSLILAITALIPFFTGVGLITIATFALHLHISFISIIGLIMIFGFSLDYGIFATDASLWAYSADPAKLNGMWTAVVLAAITTLAGFVPLVFCQHPVLQHLGQTLCIGAIGTFLGARLGIPSVVHFFRSRYQFTDTLEENLA